MIGFFTHKFDNCTQEKYDIAYNMIVEDDTGELLTDALSYPTDRLGYVVAMDIVKGNPKRTIHP